MTIAKVIERTGLTKKGVRYYESAGLIEPEIQANGYREYSHEIVKQLMLIKTLRALYFSVNEIHDCLKDEKLLLSCFSKKSEQLMDDREHISEAIKLINEFVSGEHTLEEITRLYSEADQFRQNRPRYLRHRLLQLFPGPFGEVLLAVYGKFLDDPVTAPEQKEAWEALISELDELDPVTVPEKLADWAEKHNDQELIRENYTRMREEYAQDYDAFASAKRKAVQEYLENTGKDEIAGSLQSARDLSNFLSKEGKAAAQAFGKYLPIISSQFRKFAVMQSRFLNNNPDLTSQF